ncbi:MAG: acyltransferase [Acidimicrobiales bacterium]
MSRTAHLPGLDGVRGLAVLLVVGVHAPAVLAADHRQPLPGGFLGVDLFFVLSGFLITSLLLEEREETGRASVGRFYLRRAARLLPALALLLAAHWWWSQLPSVGIPAGEERRSLLWVVTYVGNWIFWADDGFLVPGLGHLWSLAIEEQFYLVWPAVLLVAVARGRRATSLVIAAGIAIAIVVRVWLWRGGHHWSQVYTRTDARLDALLIGAGVALAARRGAPWFAQLARTPGTGVVGAAVVGIAVLTLHESSSLLFYGGFTVVAVGAALLVIGALDEHSTVGRLLAGRAITTVGQVSYGVYLWHLPILVAVQHQWPHWPLVVRATVAVGATVVITAASHLLVERHVVAWARRRTGRPASA